jgi:hypothetical protein
VRVVLDEINDYLEEKIRYNAISHRASNLEGKEFEDFLKVVEPKPSKKKIEIDHEAQMRQAQQGY